MAETIPVTFEAETHQTPSFLGGSPSDHRSNQRYESLYRSLATSYRAHDLEGLFSGGNLIGQRSVRRFMRQVLLTGVEPQERSALMGSVIANGSPQCGIARLESVDHCTLRDSPFDVEYDLTVDAGERPQVVRKHDANHDNVWTSTDSTAGRSRTIVVHESPESVDAYT